MSPLKLINRLTDVIKPSFSALFGRYKQALLAFEKDGLTNRIPLF